MNTFAQADRWTQKQSFGYGPIITEDGVAFSIRGKGYIGLGYYGRPQQELWQYDPLSNSWSQKESFPAPLCFQSVHFSIGKFGYVTTGYSNTDINTNYLWAYDADLNLWITKSDFPGSPRTGAFAITIGGKGYIGGGFGNTGLADFWEYDPLSDTWTQKNDLPEKKYSHDWFSISQKGYVVIGNDLWEYDPLNDLWTKKSAYPGSQIYRSFALAINDKGYVGSTYECWEYNPMSNTWRQQPDYPGAEQLTYLSFTIGSKGYLASNQLWSFDADSKSWKLEKHVGAISRAFAAAFTIGQKGYVGTGGHEFINLQDFWEYDQRNNAWSQKAEFPGSARSGASAFSINNKGYLGIGDTGIYWPSYANDFWEYDPLLNQWKRIADFPGAHRSKATSFSIKSKGYVGLGEHRTDDELTVLKDFWAYDPLSDKWMRKADFGGAGRYRAVGFGIGDKGYIGAGTTDQQFWEYTPTNNGWTRKADFPSIAIDGVGFSIGNKGYIHACNRHPDFFQHDPLTDEWILKTTFHGSERNGAVALAIGNKGYLGTGHNFPEFYNDFWEYTPSNEPPFANGWLMKYYSPTSVLLNAWGSYDPEGAPIKFLWQKIAGPSSYTMLYSNASTPVISNLVTGSYMFQLTVTDEQGAQAKDTVILHIQSLSTNRFAYPLTETSIIRNASIQFTVYPNPVNDVLNLKWISAFTGSATLRITDVSGKTMKEITLNKTGVDFSTSVNMHGFIPGLYHVVLMKGSQKLASTHFLNL